MKIISEGVDNFPREVNCRFCEAVIELDRDDLERGYIDRDDNENDRCEVFWQCPICSRYNDIKYVPNKAHSLRCRYWEDNEA